MMQIRVENLGGMFKDFLAGNYPLDIAVGTMSKIVYTT